MKSKVSILIAFVIGGIVFGAAFVEAQGPRPGGRRSPATALGTGFTYQGQLKNNGALVNAACDFQFGLWDAVSGGAQVSGTTTQTITTTVSSGLFTVQLDFGGNAFSGEARYLAIASRCPAGSAGFTNLTPREAITPTPYALTSLYTAYKNVLVVTTSGGQYNNITDALNSIGTSASATNSYLIYVGPGTYTGTVTMKEYVDIEGAGELTTKITQVGSAATTTGTVVCASNAELRFVTVENTGGANYATAIYCGAGSPRLTHISATASGGTFGDYGVSNSSSSPTMTNVTATASGGTENYSVVNNSASPMMTNVTATASGGTRSYAVYNASSSSPTMTNVAATASGGTNNFGVFNNVSSSPTMMNITATASGGTFSYGVSNTSSSPTMMNVTATASGGTYSSGVYNTSSSPTLTNVTATASGGTNNYGVYNSFSSAAIRISAMSGSGGTSNYGVYNYAFTGTYTVTVDNSQIQGSTYTIYNSPPFTTRVGASKLDGGPVASGGTVTCVGVYDENYASAGYTTCP